MELRYLPALNLPSSHGSRSTSPASDLCHSPGKGHPIKMLIVEQFANYAIFKIILIASFAQLRAYNDSGLTSLAFPNAPKPQHQLGLT